MKKTALFALATTLTPLLALAHPGHGSTEGYTITHYFVEMPHALLSWAGLASLFVLSYYLIREKRRKEKSSGDA